MLQVLGVRHYPRIPIPTPLSGDTRELGGHEYPENIRILYNFRFPKTINVFNVMIWGFGDMFGIYFEAFGALSNSHFAAGYH